MKKANLTALCLIYLFLHGICLHGQEFQTYKSMEYGLIKPTPYDANIKYPLVLCLHGGCPTGKNENNNTKRKIQTFGLTEKVRLENPCFVLIPQAQKAWWAGGKNHSPIEEILSFIDDELMNKFSIDKNRIYVVGYSDGGTAILHMLAWHPDTFAAAIPLSGWLKESESTSKMVKSDTAVWWFVGMNDNISPWRLTKEVLDDYKRAKGNLKLTLIDVNGNHSAPNRVYNALCSNKLVEGTRLITTGKHCDTTTTNPIDWMFKQYLGQLTLPVKTPAAMKDSTALKTEQRRTDIGERTTTTNNTPQLPTLHRWTSTSGTHVNARLISASRIEVVLEKSNGTKLTVPISALCKADQEYVQSFKK